MPGVALLARSPVYETEPVGVPAAVSGQLFLNCVVIIATTLTAPELSAAIHAVEDRLGRTRGDTPNLPRTIDIDVITLGSLRSDDPQLLLPHPRASERRFVLQPLANLRPDLILPGDTQSVSERLRALPPSPRVDLWRPQTSGK